MSNEVRQSYTTAKTVYGVVFDPDASKVWYVAGGIWETFGTGGRTRADYKAITFTEAGITYYIGSFPVAITTENTYDVQICDQAGASPVNSDTIIETQHIDWSGSVLAAITIPVTATSLCQYALSKIGGGKDVPAFSLTSIYDGTPTAAMCLVLYDVIRKEVLCRVKPNEATKFADLGAELSGVEKANWDYAFNLPTDYLCAAKQVNEDYHSSTHDRYYIEYDKQIIGRILLTNNYTNSDEDSAFIVYIYNLTDVSRFNPPLYEAMATKLAAELSAGLLADGGARRLQLIKEYEALALPLAQGHSAEETSDATDRGEYTALTCRIP